MKNLFVALLALFLLGYSGMPASSLPTVIPEGTGSRALFNKEWRFARFGAMPDGSLKAEPAGLENPDLDDAQWRRLDLPHDWGIEGPFRKDLPSNTGKLPWAGIGWYRKHFTVSSADKGGRFFVDIDGAMSHARVWLNGKYLGEWPYGYASFRLEMTDQIRFEKDNVLAVRLDNPPSSSRWYPGGGIYRNVWLVKTNPVHIAHWGTTVTTQAIQNRHATVRVRTEIENQNPEPAAVSVAVQIGEPSDTAFPVNSSGNLVQVPGNGRIFSESQLTINTVKLWSPNEPHLYRAKSSLLMNGRIIDTTVTFFGVREAKFTAESGFALNGQRVRINGVCDHHDLGPLGTAISVSALSRQIRLLKQMGCNAIRTSHNPPAPELLDLCDRMGMLVLDEAFDCWKQGKTPNDYSTLFAEWHEKDIRALVRRDRNHPCVIAWSAGNEIREQGNPALAAELREIFRSEDSTRPVTVACDNPEAGFNGFQHSVDAFGYNYKPHLYEKFHIANPAVPLYGSETASCVSTNGEYFFPVSDDKSKGFFSSQVSSYDLYAPPWATIPDVEFAGQDRNPSVAGEFVWTGFDYIGEPTPYGEGESTSRSSYFGILDLCGFPKDRFYLYQARWLPDHPMAHILPHWNWPERIGQVTPVHVYTSGDEGELFLNGVSLGRQAMGPYEYRLRWDSVVYEPGELKVVVYKNKREWAKDSMETTGTPAGIMLSADRSEISADGRDLAFITVRVVDEKGRKVPTADNLIRFTPDVSGSIVAVANGDPTDLASFQSDRYRAFHGQCLVIVRSGSEKARSIRIVGESNNLKNGSIVIPVR